MEHDNMTVYNLQGEDSVNLGHAILYHDHPKLPPPQPQPRCESPTNRPISPKPAAGPEKEMKVSRMKRRTFLDLPSVILERSLSSSEPLKAWILGTSIKENSSKKKPYTSYRIAVGHADTPEWFVEHRYSDFVTLDDMLKKEYPSHNLPIRLPKKKMTYSGSFAPGTVEQRKVQLERYLQQMLDSFPSCDILIKFLSDNMIVVDEENAAKPSPIVEGYLKKRGRKLAQFKSRWFVLSGFSLDYFYHRHDEVPAGSLPLLNAACETYNSPLSKSVFRIRTPQAEHILLADSPTDRDRWVKCITSHIALLNPITSESRHSHSPAPSAGGESTATPAGVAGKKPRGPLPQVGGERSSEAGGQAGTPPTTPTAGVGGGAGARAEEGESEPESELEDELYEPDLGPPPMTAEEEVGALKEEVHSLRVQLATALARASRAEAELEAHLLSQKRFQNSRLKSAPRRKKSVSGSGSDNSLILSDGGLDHIHEQDSDHSKPAATVSQE